MKFGLGRSSIHFVRNHHPQVERTTSRPVRSQSQSYSFPRSHQEVMASTTRAHRALASLFLPTYRPRQVRSCNLIAPSPSQHRLISSSILPRLRLRSILFPWSAAQRPLSLLLGLRRREACALGTVHDQSQVRGMKVRTSVKKFCDGCKVRCYGYFTPIVVSGLSSSTMAFPLIATLLGDGEGGGAVVERRGKDFESCDPDPC